MSMQYTFCPTCGTQRIAHGYRCSVCDGLVRRVSVHAQAAHSIARPISTPTAPQIVVTYAPERQPVAA